MAKKGLIYALLSALLFSTMNVFVKLLGDKYSTWGDRFCPWVLWDCCGAHYHVCEGHPFFKRESGAPRHAWLIRRFWYGM